VSEWPSIVWNAPALRELDARARAELEAAGRLERLGAGVSAFREGDPAEAFFAVVAGMVEVRAGGEGEVADAPAAQGRALREAHPGETFGEEAFVGGAGALRRGDAVAVRGATVARIPAALLRRVLERGASRSAQRVARAMERSATRERLRASRLAGGCTEEDLDVLLDSIAHVHLARGERIFRAGDGAERMFVIASGLVRLERLERGGCVAPAHLGAGDVFGEEDVVARRARTDAAVAAGPVWLLAVPADVARAVLARAPGVLARAHDAREARFLDGARVKAVAGGTGVLGDLPRFAVARSLVVIDEAACVQCGHCAWSCGSAHADGIARLVRRGEIVPARLDEGDAAKAVLLATSCQHCASAACMPVCPTGAITHGARGEVVLREDLCTGCGACAKACPWDAVRMAPRAGGGSVAVKCDLCTGRESGPACVDACPTGALVRVSPRAALPDARLALGLDPHPPLPIARVFPAWPFVAAGALLAGLAWNEPASKVASGAVAGGAFVVLGAHGVWKRIARRSGRAAYLVHLTVAPLAFAAMVHHVAGRVPANAAGGLVVAGGVALAAGLFGGAAYFLVPPVLARLAVRGALPEDLAAQTKALEARGYAELSGQSDRVKAVFTHLIRPYLRGSVLGLIVRGGDTRAETERLRSRVARVVAGRSVSMEEIDPLLRTAVEVRAVRAERWLHGALRGWLPAHVIAASVAVVLLAVHVLLVVVFR
jgi:Fe-S-cluster-containing dehydrogenase component/CRP-like cAMP-binding protein